MRDSCMVLLGIKCSLSFTFVRYSSRMLCPPTYQHLPPHKVSSSTRKKKSLLHCDMIVCLDGNLLVACTSLVNTKRLWKQVDYRCTSYNALPSCLFFFFFLLIVQPCIVKTFHDWQLLHTPSSVGVFILLNVSTFFKKYNLNLSNSNRKGKVKGRS